MAMAGLGAGFACFPSSFRGGFIEVTETSLLTFFILSDWLDIQAKMHSTLHNL